MSKQPHVPTDAGGCSPCAPSRRNRYYRDKRLHVADYTLEQEYHIARRRLVNRAMLGWGVIGGFAIDGEALTVGPGVALDPQGRELVACTPVKLGGDDVLWLGEGKNGCGCGLAVVDPPAEPAPKPEKPNPDNPDDDCGCDDDENPCAALYLLSAHYAEKRVDPVRIDDNCGGERCEANQVCETVVYSLRPVDCCPPGMSECRCPKCCGEDNCGCGEPELPKDDTASPPPPQDTVPPKGEPRQDDPKQAATPPLAAAAPAQDTVQAPLPTYDDHGDKDDDGKDDDHHCFTLDRGNHRQLVRWSEDPLEGFDPCGTGTLVEHGCLSLDPCGGVPLACVKLAWKCGEPHVASIVDDAHPRRLARSNETLFDLIRGCDLTRIRDVSWRHWLPGATKVRLSEFQRMFLAPVDTPDKPDNRRRRTGTVMTRFAVRFTGPVRTETLTPDVVAVTLIQRETREAVGDMVRVPIVSLSPLAQLSTDPPGTTRGFSIVIDRAFYAGEIDPYDASGFEEATGVEIEIRTDWILDCNGQEVAGGGRGVPSTGSVPGGRHLSSFTVLPDAQCEPAPKPTAGAPASAQDMKEA